MTVSRPGTPWEDEFDPGPPTAEQMAEQEAILAEQEAVLADRIAAGGPALPPGELMDFRPDPDAGPPGGEHAWLGELPGPVLAKVLAEQDAAQAAGAGPSAFDDVITRDGRGPGGPGFASGSALDELAAGPVLACAVDDAWSAGLERLPDDELAGVMLAFRRLESHGSAGLLAGASELTRRREAGHRQALEHLDHEVGLLLSVTRRSAARLLTLAANLARLPATSAALAAGRIDRVKADLIAYETALLEPELAGAVELLVIEDAPRLTTTGLQRRLRRAVLAADPSAARRRVEEAARDARVELTDERSGGTAALAGRDLPAAAAMAADQRVDAGARALKAAGTKATLAQLRAAVFLGLLTGHDPLTFLPPAEGSGPPAATATPPATTPPATAPAPASGPSSLGTTSTATSGTDPGHPAEPAGPRHPAKPASPGHAAEPAGPDRPAKPTTPGHAAEAADTASAPGSAATGSWALGPLRVRGSVHLTMPLSAWLGATHSPGEVTGFGSLTAETCRDLAEHIARSPGTRWCLTLTNAAGHAVGHACARRPPPRATDTAGMAAWLARLKPGPVQSGTCTHAREVPGYRIPDSLHHIVKIRQKTCCNPVCVRPAQACDDDHTRPHDQGGRTCECGLAPACRTCHRTKQAPGWHLEQPSPGVLVWQPPHGRSYTVGPGVYPA